MVITYEIEKTVTVKVASLETLVYKTHTDVIKYIDKKRQDVLDEFRKMTKQYSGWNIDEYDVDNTCPSYIAHTTTNTVSKKVEMYMRSAMYYENDYEGMM